MIAKLRDLGADLDVADQNGHTALMAAVVDGNLDTFVALLRHGADPHAEGTRRNGLAECDAEFIYY